MQVKITLYKRNPTHIQCPYKIRANNANKMHTHDPLGTLEYHHVPMSDEPAKPSELI